MKFSLLNKKPDEWHQYDGVIAKEPPVWRDWVFSWRKELVKHAKRTVQYFSDCIIEAEDSKYSLIYVLDQLEVLLSCMRKIYFQDAKCWEEYKEVQFKEEVLYIRLEFFLFICLTVPPYPIFPKVK